MKLDIDEKVFHTFMIFMTAGLWFFIVVLIDRYFEK